MLKRLLIPVLAAALLAGPAAGQTASPTPRLGMVVLHGKGGAPDRLVADMAAALEAKGARVISPEMPWSGRRQYDTDVAGADREVAAALDRLRAGGATHVFVVGHSQGGLFALHFGGVRAVDGIVAIAPGGNVANTVFREHLGETVALARQLIAEGKGNEATELADFENRRGRYPVQSTPANYVSWFDPEGAMNQTIAIGRLRPQTPVLFVAPTDDYPGLRKVMRPMFEALPRHPLTRLYQPQATHTGAPSASSDVIYGWASEVAGVRP